MTLDIDHHVAVFRRGADELLVESELRAKLARGTPLNVKEGFDPTRPDLHLGHTVQFNQLPQLQDLGHHVVFLVGDFTTLIGDPTGRNVTRPALSPDEVAANAKTYTDQAFLILDREKTEVAFNSDWLRALGSDGMIRLAAKYTVARMLERDDFAKRYAAGQPIAIHEFLYPLAQGYDSVCLHTDVELGGTEAPASMFGKLMSISDTLMWRYYTLLSFRPEDEITQLRRECEAGRNPREAKAMLAHEIVARFHSKPAADAAEAEFDARFRHGALPENMPEVTLHAAAGGMPVAQLAKQAGLVESTSEALRLIAQRGLKLDGEVVTDKALVVSSGTTVVVQAGKRKFARVTVK